MILTEEIHKQGEVNEEIKGILKLKLRRKQGGTYDVEERRD